MVIYSRDCHCTGCVTLTPFWVWRFDSSPRAGGQPQNLRMLSIL